MKTNQERVYEPPQAEVLEIQVEQAILNGSFGIDDLIEDEWY